MGEARAGEVRTLFCDTNVLVRVLTNDPPNQTRHATRALTRAFADGTPVRVLDAVVAELVYVITRVYGLPKREAADRIARLLVQPYLNVDDVALGAIDIWRSTPADFIDAYVAAVASASDGGAILSFDRDLDRVQDVSRVDPGSIR